MKMYFQFLIEDSSTAKLIKHVMDKMQIKHPDREILYEIKYFSGIGHLGKKGNLMERKGNNLLNNLPLYMKAFDKALKNIDALLVVVVDNDKRNNIQFRKQLEQVAETLHLDINYIFCIAVKEMEAWLLGDEQAILEAYPYAKRKYLKSYIQDGICDTWQVLANMVYPGGLNQLMKIAKNGYGEIGKAKGEWADKIGERLDLERNVSPSFQYLLAFLENSV